MIKKSPKRKLVTRRELANLLNVTMSGVTKWEQAGMPVAERGRKGKASLYSEAEAKNWLAERDKAARENGTFDLARERARKERAQAILAEQTVAIRAGDLVPVDQISKTLTAGFGAFRAKVLAWQATMSDALYRESKINGLQGVQRAIKDAAEELLLDLSKAIGVPKPKRVTAPRKSGRRKK